MGRRGFNKANEDLTGSREDGFRQLSCSADQPPAACVHGPLHLTSSDESLRDTWSNAVGPVCNRQKTRDLYYHMTAL